MSNFVRDVKFMLDLELGIYWKFCWLAFIPVSLSGILAYVLLSLELPTMDGLYYPMSAYGMPTESTTGVFVKWFRLSDTGFHIGIE